MTLALNTAPTVARPRAASRPIILSGWDVLAVAALLALWAVLFLLRYDALPIQLWDESRNANNALEMALHGRWLTPTYASVVDHWNTKPPLLIWAMAAGLRLGLPTLVALRLTSWLAAAATGLGVWAALRFAAKDRLAAFAGALMLFSAAVYIGPHAARTGDYDALESAFIAAYVLAFWGAVETGRLRWLYAAAACMALGVMTKGVAAVLPLPGLAVFALTRPRRLAGWLTDWRAWGAAALFLAVAGGYYLSREAYDPGYLSVIAHNELGGRFMAVTENHRGSWHFYLRVLAEEAEPCALLSALGLLTLFGKDARRRSLVLASGLAAASLLLVLSASRSKMEWYATPIVPLLSVTAGLGLSDALDWMRDRRPAWAGAARAGAALVLACGAVYAIACNQLYATGPAGSLAVSQMQYGELFAALRTHGVTSPVAVLDSGFHNDAGFVAYDPMLKFYAELFDHKGLRLTVTHQADGLSSGQLAATCDPRVLQALQEDYRLQPLLTRRGCLLARIGEAIEE